MLCCCIFFIFTKLIFSAIIQGKMYSKKQKHTFAQNYGIMDAIIQTARLSLRKFTAADSVLILELLNDPGWLRYIGDRNVKTKEQAVAYLENGPIKSYAEHGYGLSQVSIRATGEPIGMCGIICRPTLEHPDIGFAFLERHTGQGYGYEIASEVLKHAKEALGIATIQAITVPYNTASIRLLEKIGMKSVKTFTMAEDSEPLLLYQS
jgi:RimJ/RimL family protein N-acetyltransferase